MKKGRTKKLAYLMIFAFVALLTIIIKSVWVPIGFIIYILGMRILLFLMDFHMRISEEHTTRDPVKISSMGKTYQVSFDYEKLVDYMTNLGFTKESMPEFFFGWSVSANWDGKHNEDSNFILLNHQSYIEKIDGAMHIEKIKEKFLRALAHEIGHAVDYCIKKLSSREKDGYQFLNKPEGEKSAKKFSDEHWQELQDCLVIEEVV